MQVHLRDISICDPATGGVRPPSADYKVLKIASGPDSHSWVNFTIGDDLPSDVRYLIGKLNIVKIVTRYVIQRYNCVAFGVECCLIRLP